MSSKYFSKGLKRSALTVALGLCFAGGVQAQSSVGSIFGDAAANTAVSIENLDNGTSRSITSDSTGRFAFSQLAPGRYRVTTASGTREVQVKIGTGTSVSFVDSSGEATNLETVTVVGSSAINPIDVSSVESTSVFTQQQIQRLPVGRDITNVALLAPGTVKGDTGFGNLASFGGSSVAENGYYINGFDVTNIRNFVSYAAMPFDAIAEQQVKTGGYGAEYGRSLGGVINLLTKRGTNEWKGGVSVYWSPDWGREAGKDVLSRNPEDLVSGDTRLVYRSDNKVDQLEYNLYGGGPIIKDRLFIFGLIAGQDNSSDQFGSRTSVYRSDKDPSALIKLDWNITDNHLLEFTAIQNETDTKIRNYTNLVEPSYLGTHQTPNSYNPTQTNGGQVYIGKYTGFLTDNFTLSLMAGRLENTDTFNQPQNFPGGECVRAYDSRGANPGAVNYIGCWVDTAATTFVRDPNFGPDTDLRQAYRADAEWRIGDHFVRFGYDTEKFTSGHAGQTYTGGEYWRYYQRVSNVTINGVVIPAGTSYARRWIRDTASGTYEVENTAFYLEDSWQVTDNLLLYIGARSESFKNFNGDGIAFVEASNQIAPRLGFSWDVNGDSSFKVFGNAGRYYIPVASNTNIRASAAEVFTEAFFYTDGPDLATGRPRNLGAQIGQTSVNGSLEAPNPATVAVTDLEPMYQDEFILGIQKQMTPNWTLGMRAISREVKSGMDDYCGHAAFTNWAADNGYVNFDSSTLATCIIMNPGRDVSIALDLNSDGNLTEVTVPNSYLGLPQYLRKYHALEFFWERNGNDKWYLQGSYTFAKSKGNIEGYVNSSLEQDDAGLTQDFDHRSFMDGSYGYLPNDRRHTLKMFGSYELTDSWRLGGSMVVQSGRPVNCQGYVPLPGDEDDGNLNAYGPSSFYCTDASGTQYLSNRGDFGRTPWTWNFDMSVAYVPQWASKKLTLQVDVFNLFNLDRVTEYNETSNKTGRNPLLYDPNFLNDVNYQTPRSLRFTVRYEF